MEGSGRRLCVRMYDSGALPERRIQIRNTASSSFFFFFFFFDVFCNHFLCRYHYERLTISYDSLGTNSSFLKHTSPIVLLSTPH